jgi:hypothetical protein
MTKEEEGRQIVERQAALYYAGLGSNSQRGVP